MNYCNKWVTSVTQRSIGVLKIFNHQFYGFNVQLQIQMQEIQSIQVRSKGHCVILFRGHLIIAQLQPFLNFYQGKCWPNSLIDKPFSPPETFRKDAPISHRKCTRVVTKLSLSFLKVVVTKDAPYTLFSSTSSPPCTYPSPNPRKFSRPAIFQ